ncbi:hypothetical protein C2G38_2081854 [Gigaspora rosea]|uniref:Phosphatidylglycerol/phosphatidylinositol transfer protein n=1 Tax=Gigaspora rosea TaxID=44941 RepID=A0A397VDB2_9GLOM|nr:hypothetical protein C2G38_2081854 [Gigaspora rosea]
MNQNFVLILVLLIMLSIVNAIPHQLHKRKTKFGSCGLSPVLDVSVSPDPIVANKNATYTISGILKKDITDAYQLFILYFVDGAKRGNKQNFDICTEIKCPVKAGKKFEMKQKSLVPPGLPPNGYSIGVGIINSKSEVIGSACTLE